MCGIYAYPPPEGRLRLPQYTVEVVSFHVLNGHAEFYLHIRSTGRAGQAGVGSSWNISRRFVEFQRLHKLLAVSFPSVMARNPLPATQLAFSKRDLLPVGGAPSPLRRRRRRTLPQAKLETRRVLLDAYLQGAVAEEELGRCHELGQFLSNRSQLFPNDRDGVRRGWGRSLASSVSSIAKETFRGFRRDQPAPATVQYVPRRSAVSAKRSPRLPL